jgi:UDP-2,4-diacetamido-2,4,6-trideoxy-beta-L-altropyranose hydrolase
LAKALVARGLDVRFLCRVLPGDYCKWLEDSGFEVLRLGDTGDDVDADIAQSRAALEGAGEVDWLVVDHYGVDARWERALRSAARRILVIDDAPGRPHDCDALLDQNFTVGGPASASDRYAGLVPPGARRLLGPRYALLDPAFAERRAGLRSREGSVRRVLVCFGGADPQGHTMAAIEALRPHARRVDRIDVAVGSASPHKASIAIACADLPNVQVHCPARDMAALIADADLAIGAGGSMNWERACLAVPTLAFGIVENQRPVLASLIEAGCVAGSSYMPKPDVALIGAWVSSLLGSPEILRGLSTRSAALVDGRGAERVVEALFLGRLEFRRATPADGENLLRWRNHPEVRAASLDAAEIARSTHEAWMARTLADPQRILLVAERRGGPVGVVRFDLLPPEAVISVYRVPAAEGAGGLVRQASEWLQANYPEIRRITAEVLSANGASLAAFRNAGYRDARNTLVKELDTP